MHTLLSGQLLRLVASCAVGNFNWKDWATFAGTAAACYPFGWVVGKACMFAPLLKKNPHCRSHVHFLSAGVAPKVPKQSALMGATIGALGGFMLAHQQSAGV